MRKIFVFKKLSWKFAFIIGMFVVIVAGAIAGYMQTRIIAEIGVHSRLNLQHEVLGMVNECDLTFTEAAHTVATMRHYIEANFDVGAYRENAEQYINTGIRPYMDGFLYNIIDKSKFIDDAYFAVHPDLAGYPYVCEIGFVRTESGIEIYEPQTYEEYMQTDSEYMEWFYGAYTPGAPYWSPIVAWVDGTLMAGYAEPIFAGGTKIGVVAVDVSISHLEDLVRKGKVYDTGFYLLKDNNRNFLETNDVIKMLGSDEKESLINVARANRNNVFETGLGGVNYIGASATLFNGYEIYILAPKNEVNAEVNASIIRFIIIFVIALTIVLIFAYHIGKGMSKPLIAISGFMRRAASIGDVTFHAEDTELTDTFAKIADETGQTIRDCIAFFEHVSHVAGELETVAKGDLTTEIEVLSGVDVMGKSLKHMVDSLNYLFLDINSATAQVAAGSKQIADGSQTLAQGSTQQAASVEQLSASISEIAQKTKDNADMAVRAAVLAGTIKDSAETGSRQMDEMMSAVGEINQASQNIQKVIKVVDDIAFQTNILALNAAVEAARAGQHGKGFAVVAEEVRSLASKSAEAAKDTGSLIANSIEKAKLGSRIADETAASLSEIVSGINESTQIVSEIARSSEQQSMGIAQINHGIDQVANVVQQNSAAAEESAAASEEMSGLSTMLEELIAQFKLKNDNRL